MQSLKRFLDADRELKRRVVSYLAGQHVPALRSIQVQAFNGAVTLRGNVRSFFEKQLGQHSVQRVAGVHKVIDEVEVIWPVASTVPHPVESPARSQTAGRSFLLSRI